MLSGPKKIPVHFTDDERELARLILEVSKGNDASMATLYDRTSSLVFGLILKILADRPEAEEVLGDVYLQIWEKAGSYDPARSKPVTWIIMLARSRTIDKLRSGARRKELVSELNENQPSADSNPESKSLYEEKRKMVKNALSELNDNQRKALELAYFYGMSQSEIADEMGKPLGTVKSWIRFGLNALRSKIVKKD